MKIYTGTGDRGKTSLFSGQRVSKADERIEAYGDMDELNSIIGALVASLGPATFRTGRRIAAYPVGPLYHQRTSGHNAGLAFHGYDCRHRSTADRISGKIHRSNGGSAART